VSTEADRRAAFEDECLDWVRRYLADDAPLGGEMKGHRGRLLSLTLDRTSGEAEIVAEMVLLDGSPLTERYGIWTYGEPRPPTLDEPHGAREAGFMIAMGITSL
jgi:hypothetical protein